MFVVCFVRADGRPNEEYYYTTLEAAVYHFSLFASDDSGLYSQIRVINIDEKLEICYNVFDYDERERGVIT